MELLNHGKAEALLNEVIPGETPGYWRRFLQNNRNIHRHPPYRIPFEKLGGGVYYARDDLTKFSEWEKGRRLGSIKLTGRAAEVMRAFGIGEVGGTTTGRKLTVDDISPQVDQASGTPFVRLVIADPLLIYRLELSEAQAIARYLLEAVSNCESEKL